MAGMQYFNKMNRNDGDEKLWVMELQNILRPRRKFDFLGSVTKPLPMSWLSLL